MKLTSLLVSCFVMLMTAYATSASTTTEDGLHKLLEEIEANAGDLPNSNALLASRSFAQLRRAPSQYMTEAVRFITNPQKPDKSKKILIYGMQSLPLREYVAFSDSVYRGYKIGDTSQEIVHMLVFANVQFGAPLIKHYKDPDARSWLQQLKDDNTLDEKFRTNVEKVLSGEVSRKLK
jgi:hypothetical protein